MVNLDEVLTFSEAAEKWGLADGKSIRKAVERGRFETHEIKRSGNVWLTTYDAMLRIFGSPCKTTNALYYFELFEMENTNRDSILATFHKKALDMIEQGEMISIAQSKEHPDRIICILKTKEEVEGWIKRMTYFLQSI